MSIFSKKDRTTNRRTNHKVQERFMRPPAIEYYTSLNANLGKVRSQVVVSTWSFSASKWSGQMKQTSSFGSVTPRWKYENTDSHSSGFASSGVYVSGVISLEFTDNFHTDGSSRVSMKVYRNILSRPKEKMKRVTMNCQFGALLTNWWWRQSKPVEAPGTRCLQISGDRTSFSLLKQKSANQNGSLSDVSKF